METFLQFSGSQRPVDKHNSLSDTEEIRLFFFIAAEKLTFLCYSVQGAKSAPNCPLKTKKMGIFDEIADAEGLICTSPSF